MTDKTIGMVGWMDGRLMVMMGWFGDGDWRWRGPDKLE